MAARFTSFFRILIGRGAAVATMGAQLLVRTFHLDRPREENVVFQMDVLVQVGFECRQRSIKRLEADAGIRRRCICLLYTSP
ncbi:MAG: hypothetical protein WBL61_24560, partial [Bryobacteraceae bacterium]